MYTAEETTPGLLYEVAGGELSDEQLIEMIGEERFNAMMEDDDGATPTLVYDLRGETIFITFKSCQEVEFLISDLANLLAYGKAELAIRCPGKIVPFREAWDDEKTESDINEGDIPTLVYDLRGENIFITFKSRQDVEDFLSRLANMLARNDKEFSITCPGKIVPFRETWEDDEDENS